MITSTEVIQQFLDSLKDISQPVSFRVPVTQNAVDFGYGFVECTAHNRQSPIPDETSLKEYFRPYKHYIVLTKYYRTEDSAAQKVIQLTQLATQGAKIIYWRVKPKVVWYKDFDRYRTLYQGRARFSVL